MYEHINQTWQAVAALLISPFNDLSVLWQLAPIVAMWVFLEIYFGRYKHEDLGGNTALGNGVTLFWICASSMRHLTSELGTFTWTKFSILLAMFLYAMFIIIIVFRHALPQRIIYTLSSPTPILYLGSIVVLYTYDTIIIDQYMVAAIVVVFVGIVFLSWIIKRSIPEKNYPWA